MTAAARREHDVIGVGLGPFNLGLAALLDRPDVGLDAAFFEARPSFSWHAGLLLDGATLQVPFLADLVTLADPTSRHSFLSYLHDHDRLFRFYFYERFHVPRREFDAYCRWVADRLATCRFGHRVRAIAPLAGGGWSVKVEGVGGVEEHRAAAVVLGVGTQPWVPDALAAHLGDDVLHSASYADRAPALRATPRVTVVGSGQSAAEVVADLLTHRAAVGAGELAWFTRSRGFLPMEYSKLGLEHFTPEYATFFHGLPEATRDAIRADQDLLYKGIDAETSAAIYDALYERTVGGGDPGLTYAAGFEVVAAEATPGAATRWALTLRHRDEGSTIVHATDAVVAATGYRPAELPLADAALVARDAAGRPVVERDFRLRRADGEPSTLFVQNGELHTHGVGAPDLGLGAHRSAAIVNALAGREVYRQPDRTVFQRFGAAQVEGR